MVKGILWEIRSMPMVPNTPSSPSFSLSSSRLMAMNKALTFLWWSLCHQVYYLIIYCLWDADTTPIQQREDCFKPIPPCPHAASLQISPGSYQASLVHLSLPSSRALEEGYCSHVVPYCLWGVINKPMGSNGMHKLYCTQSPAHHSEHLHFDPTWSGLPKN